MVVLLVEEVQIKVKEVLEVAAVQLMQELPDHTLIQVDKAETELLYQLVGSDQQLQVMEHLVQ